MTAQHQTRGESSAQDLRAFGTLAARTLLENLDQKGYRTHSKHLINFLSPEEQNALFEALMLEATQETSITVRTEPLERRTLRLIVRETFDLLPIQVLADKAPLFRDNQGVEGFASALRDNFAVDASRTRVLLVVTGKGNETQQSATDAEVDRALLRLPDLVEQVLRDLGVDTHEELREVVNFTLKRPSSQENRFRTLLILTRFVQAVKAHPEQSIGQHLPVLGGFFADPSPDAIHGLPLPLPKGVTGGKSRLESNAALYSHIHSVLEDVLKDPVRQLSASFDDESVRTILAAGSQGLKTLKVDQLQQERSTAKPNRFVMETVTVQGAHHWVLVQEPDNTQVIVVSASAKVKIGLKMERNLDPAQEHLLILGPKKGNTQGLLGKGKSQQGGLEASFELSPAAPFSVFELSLARGKRTTTRQFHGLYVVIYRTSTPLLAFPIPCEVGFERQAWIAYRDEVDISVVTLTEHGIQDTRQALTLEEYRAQGSDLSGDDEDELINVSLEEGLSLRFLVPQDIDLIEDSRLDLLEHGVYGPRPLNREEALAYLTHFNQKSHYLQALKQVSLEGLQQWRVALDHGRSPLITAYNSYSQEEAVAHLLFHPELGHLTRDHQGNLSGQVIDGTLHACLQELVHLRQQLFESLRTCAPTYESTAHGAEPVRRVPWMLIDLHLHQDLVRAYMDCWLRAIEANTADAIPFQAIHRTLLQLDVLECKDERQHFSRLIVLPTHPWLLSALLEFQLRVAADIKGTTQTGTPQRKGGTSPLTLLNLTQGEINALIPHQVLEDWYIPGGAKERLRVVDGAPFCWEYLPVRLYQHKAELEYVRRVVANKIDRYLTMHPHLQNDRRTLRLGFVHPGDGKQILEGLRRWLKAKLPAGKDTDPAQVERVMHQIPHLEVLLFLGKKEEREEEASVLDDFFREKLEWGEDKEVDRLLLSRLRYGKLEADHPKAGQHVHICFVQGLIKLENYGRVDADLSKGWDGCFGDGLLAASLRTTLPGSRGKELLSQRGLWVATGDKPHRRGIVALLTLLRGASLSSIRPGFGVHWSVELPSEEKLLPYYQHCDWVAHLDRELSLELFQERPSASNLQPQIIEYSDQEDPDSPGYDVITVTANAAPYFEQLDSVLQMADLILPSDRQTETAKRAGKGLLKVVNLLSGTWALDFLEGNLSQERRVNRLIGNVGAALVYRWILRVEAPVLDQLTHKQAVPLFISLEELIRATPSAGLPMSPGLRQRTRDRGENPEKYCDDLLVLYLVPAKEHQKLRMFGRVIEVKFGKSASFKEAEAVQQVRETHNILQQFLSGQHQDRSDAPFRNQQLSLLIKAQLDQEVAQQALTPERRSQLNTTLLSAKLSSGDYEVDYLGGHETQQTLGDVFLLDTSPVAASPQAPLQGGKPPQPQAQVTVRDGVRVIRLSRPLLEWLAYEEEDAGTHRSKLTHTLPHIGTFGKGLLDQLKRAAKQALAEEALAEEALAQAAPAEAASAEAAPAPTAEPPLAEREPAVVEATPEPVRPDAPANTTESLEPVALEVPPPPPPVEAPRAAHRPSPAKPSGAAAHLQPVRQSVAPEEQLSEVIQLLNDALIGHKINLESPASIKEVDCGPRLIRAYVRLRAGESIANVRKISEDIARMVGTTSLDIHISNVPERRAVGLDLPIENMGYEVTFDDVMGHVSAQTSRQTHTLGFCAGIEVTGRAKWVDLETMPHMLVAGTTGSGKTVFLRTLLLTLAQQHGPEQLQLRLSSTKPMDFRPFEKLPHAGGHKMAEDAASATRLVESLVLEMERRIGLLSDAICDNLTEYNQDPSVEEPLPRIVAVLDEYAETVLSFSDKAERKSFEESVGRLAQKARAAGIHLILCMQRPDSTVIQGAIKSNVSHRFALKLPQNVDSRVMLDESGAEALLGKGDLLYKDGDSRFWRLQVPSLDKDAFRRALRGLMGG